MPTSTKSNKSQWLLEDYQVPNRSTNDAYALECSQLPQNEKYKQTSRGECTKDSKVFNEVQDIELGAGEGMFIASNQKIRPLEAIP